MTNNEHDPNELDNVLDFIIDVNATEATIESLRANVEIPDPSNPDHYVISLLISWKRNTDAEPIPPMIMPDEPLDE